MAESEELTQVDLEELAEASKPEVKKPKEKKSYVEEDITESVHGFKTEEEIRRIDAEKKYIRAAYLFEVGDLDEALMMIRASLALWPTNPKYHYNIGFLYWRKGLLEIAVNHYKLFVRYAPSTHKELQAIKDRTKYLENEIRNKMKRR